MDWHLFFLTAMIYNLSLLIFNRFFTSNRLAEVYPEVFSKFGQLIIILFGFIFYFSYISHKSKELFILLAIEKFIYFLTGLYWIIYRSHLLKLKDYPLEWLFMRIYWIGDLTYGLGFLYFYMI